jgi:hypothetical protein
VEVADPSGASSTSTSGEWLRLSLLLIKSGRAAGGRCAAVLAAAAGSAGVPGGVGRSGVRAVLLIDLFLEDREQLNDITVTAGCFVVDG